MVSLTVRHLILGALTISLTTPSISLAAKIDDEQDKKLLKLARQLKRLEAEVSKSKKKLATQSKEISSQSKQITAQSRLIRQQQQALAKSKNSQMKDEPKIAPPQLDPKSQKEFDKLSKEINTVQSSLNKINKAIKGGLDKSFVQSKLVSLKRQLTELEQKKVQIMSPKVKKTFHRNFEGVMEFATTFEKTYAGVKSSDYSLSTVEIGYGQDINEWTEASVTFKYTSSSDKVTVDDAIFSFGNPDKTPFFLNVGKDTLPFAKNETNLYSGPLQDGITDTTEEHVTFGVNYKGLSASIYSYNGTADRPSVSDRIRGFGGAVDYSYTGKNWGLSIGYGYIKNFADLSGVSGKLSTANKVTGELVAGHDYSLAVNLMGLTLITEYVTAAKKFESNDISFNNKGATPSMYQFEVAYEFKIGDMTIVPAISHQISEESLQLELPKTRTAYGFAWEVVKNATFEAEYYTSKDYKASKGGTGKKDESLTLNLAVAF